MAIIFSKIRLLGYASFMGLSFVSLAEAKTFWMPSNQFEMGGGWQVQEDSTGLGAKEFLIATGTKEKIPAVGALEIPNAGKWRVWVRTKDFAKDRPGTRTFSIRLGDTTLEKKFGGHGLEGDFGWAWEDGGTLDLKAGPLLLVLGEKVATSARCEAILFTDNMSYVPDGRPAKLEKERAKVVPLALGGEQITKDPVHLPLTGAKEESVAKLENEKVRVTFHSGQTTGGAALGVKAAVFGDGRWQPLSDDAATTNWQVLARAVDSNPQFFRGRAYPSWDMGLSPLLKVEAGGANAMTREGPSSTTPWTAGECYPVRPSSAKQVDAGTIELEFPPTPWGTLRSTWKLKPGRSYVEISSSFKPSKPGYFSLGFQGPLAAATNEADSWLLPFQFQGDRFPDKPVMLVNATTPTPMTLVSRGGISCSLVAEPSMLPFEWQRMERSPFGFGLRNEEGKAQPMIYSPVMGLEGSKSEGSPVETKYRLWLERADWYQVYRQVADGLFGLNDYRRPTTFSTNDTIFNLIDLMKNEPAAGWDARAKGSVQIESRNVVSQASPLTYMSLYLLTGDEDLYQRFARPSLEYLISRSGAHFAIEKEIGDRYYEHQPMKGPVKMYGAATYASALAMTQGRSPVFGELSFEPDGSVRKTAGGHVQDFDDLLMLYRVTGNKQWLDQAVVEGDKYLVGLAKKKKTSDPGGFPFVNVKFAPNWEGLLHLYEASGETRFRDAAVAGAKNLLTTVWTQPMIPDAEVTLNPGGVYDNARGIWWWADQRKRLGIYEGPASESPIKTEAPKIPERKVPAWTVSNIGLGLEHPFTYNRPGGQANIMMSNWAPNLLRVSAASGDPAFRVAARNSTIGRYANYPGYYLDGQTDEFRRADYPVKGPDITSLYLHHIPPFAASMVDFLFTEVETRSAGKVSFPWVRQCGYVWFDSRLWGHAPGSVYGQEAWPWLHRTAARMDDPSIDLLLAQGAGKFHVVLLNQTKEEKEVTVTFDGKALGRSLDEADLQVLAENQPAGPLKVKNGSARVKLKPSGITVLSLDGVKIDVPTQRKKPSPHFEVTAKPAQTLAKVEGTEWTARASMIEAPPFSWRDLYVYIDAGREDLKSAVLRYKLGDGTERTIAVDGFPFEFTARLDDPGKPVSWEVEVRLPDGSLKKTARTTGTGSSGKQ